jgi:hypothetical protein
MQGRAKEHRSDRFPRTRPSRPPTRSGGQGQRSNVAIGYTTQGTSSIHDRRRSRTHPAEVQWLFQSTCSIGLFRRGPFSGRGRGRTNKTAVGRPRSAVSGEETLTPPQLGPSRTPSVSGCAHPKRHGDRILRFAGRRGLRSRGRQNARAPTRPLSLASGTPGRARQKGRRPTQSDANVQLPYPQRAVTK